MAILSLLLALGVITIGAELLVRGASFLALRAGVSALFVGLTIVGIGTSTPELGASLFAALEGSNGVSIGNVVGSNIFNIGVILGLTALARPIYIELRAVRRDLLVALAVACAPLAALAFGGELPRAVGGVFVACLVAYLTLAFRAGRRAHADQQERAGEELRSTLAIAPALSQQATTPWKDRTWVNVAFVLAGFTCLLFGSRAFVGRAIALATELGMSEKVIGLTIVSVGTSLPELVTSVVAAWRGNQDIAIGNVIGSNVFNILGVLGICAIVRPQAVPASMLAVDLPVMILATICLLPIIKSGGKISRMEGGLLASGYGVYLAWLLIGG